MRHFILALFILLGLVARVEAELSREGAAFLQEMGIDPNSALIKSIAEDVVIFRGDPTMLDEFATKKQKNAVRRFVMVRSFIRDYRRNPNTPLPTDKDFNFSTVIGFLTDEERVLAKPVLDKLQKAAEKELQELLQKTLKDRKGTSK